MEDLDFECSSSQDCEDQGDEEDFEDAELSSQVDAHRLQKGEFFGCYLLISKNPKFKGRTYIGFTVDPNRRIRQHNAGCQMGGARKTSGRGPWEMVLIVHGFPNEITALRFEWAWQNPNKSRRLGKDVVRRKARETPFHYRFRVLAAMLRTGPWCRLPLTIRWLKQEHQLSFPLDRQPPVHMPFAYGLVDITKNSKCQTEGRAEVVVETEGRGEEGGRPQGGEGCGADTKAAGQSCWLCRKSSEEATACSLVMLRCYHDDCTMAAHATCLAPRLCGAGEKHILPVSGSCPACSRPVLWGEMVRRYQARQRRRREEEKLVQNSQGVQDSQPPCKKSKRRPITEPVEHWTTALRV